MNILTNSLAQSNSVSCPPTTDATSKDLESPANMLTRRWKLNGTPVNGVKEQMQGATPANLHPTESMDELQRVHNTLTQQPSAKLGLQKLPSNVCSSAFTPVYNTGQTPTPNTASNNFWQAS